MAEGNIKYIFCSARHIDVESPLHLQNTMEIVLVTKGTVCIEIGDKTFSISAGQGVFIRPFELHCYKKQAPNVCHVLMFSGELVNYFFKYSKTHIPATPVFTFSPETLKLTDSLLPEIENTADPIRAQAVLAPLCNEIYTQCGFTERALPPQDAFGEAINYIRANFTDSSITSKQLAKKVGLHPVTLSKGFNRIVGFGFNEYLNHLRCSNAAMLLTTTDDTVADIAFLTGFGSIRSFNRAFLNAYGVTPSEYRTRPIV